MLTFFMEQIVLLKKIKYVFDYMKIRKDVVFVWRPEPGIEGKFGELPSNVVEDYLHLRKCFIDEKIGVYDTTDDEGVASVLTDAYIGDGHPMMNLFGLQGKPIVLLDGECRHLPLDDELCSVSFLDCAVDDKNIWFVADEYNVLCKMNLTSGETEVISEIPDEKVYGGPSYCGIIKVNNQIYIDPHRANAFVTFNIDNKKITKKYLSQSLEANFDYLVPYKEYLFLKAKFYPAIVQFNTVTQEYKYYTSWVEEIEKYVLAQDMNEPYFLWGVVVCQDKLMLASSKANVIMEFNMETGAHRFFEIGPRGSKFFGMEYDGENFWLIPYLGKNIIRWNCNTGDWETYNSFTNEIEDQGIPFRAIIKYDKSLMVFPCHADFGLTIEFKENNIQKTKICLPYTQGTYKSEFYKKADTVYNFVKSFGKEIILAEAMYDASILLFNLKENKINKMPCRIPIKNVKSYYNKMITNNRDTAKYPCSISETDTLRVVFEFFTESKCLINSNVKQIYNSKIEGHMNKNSID